MLISVQTPEAGGEAYAQFAAQWCRDGHGYLLNDTGTSLDVKIGATGDPITVAAGAGLPFALEFNCNELFVRRTDQATTQVLVKVQLGIEGDVTTLALAATDAAAQIAEHNSDPDAHGGLVVSVAAEDITNAGATGIEIMKAATPAAGQSALRLVGGIPYDGLIVGYDSSHVNTTGGKVVDFIDITGGGNNATQANATYRATATKSGAVLAGTSGYTLTTPIQISKTSASVVFVYSVVPTRVKPSSGTSALYMDAAGNGISVARYVLGLNASGELPSCRVNAQVLTQGTDGRRNYHNAATAYATDSALSAGNVDISAIFQRNDGTFPMSVNWCVRAVLFYNRVLEEHEIDQILTAYSVHRFGPDSLLAVGDSITSGSGTTYGAGWAIGAALDLGLPLLNTGVDGRTAAQAVAAGVTAANRHVLRGARQYTVVAYGSNDIAENADLATLESNIQTICGYYKNQAAGPKMKVLVASILPRTTSFTGGQDAAGFETDRLDYRTWLLANYSTFADGVIDVGDPATALGNVANIATYFSDGTHPNDAGNALYKTAALAALRAIF